MGVVRLPGREEHGQTWAQSGEDASGRRAQAHGSCLEQTGEGAVERVDTMVEELAETARSSGSSGLLSIHIVQGLVHEQTECEAKVQP